jgi:hypothetical protein
MPKALSNKVKHAAIDAGISVQELVVRALEAYLSKKGGRP